MKSVLSCAVLGAATLCPADMAQANDAMPKSNETYSVYETIDDWTVYTISSRQSCVAEKRFGNGEVVLQMGATRDQSRGYLGVFTTEDVDVKRRQKVVLDIDGATFESIGLGARNRKLDGGYKGGYIAVTSQALAEALASGETLTVIPSRTAPFELDLDGLGDAMQVGAKCITAQNS